jgi:hypothetical protein
MIRILELNTGQVIGMAIAEITAVPYFELYDKNLEKALHLNQVFFTQVLTALHKKSSLNQSAAEILWHSVPVKDQAFKAQVKMYLIIRKICKDEAEAKDSLQNLMTSLVNDFVDKHFSINIYDEPQEIAEFEANMSVFQKNKVVSISRKEKAITNNTMANGLIYYNPVIFPSAETNIAFITNAMVQYPNSLISMQIIPTTYNQQELIAIEECKRYLDYYVSNVKYGQGIAIDPGIQEIITAYDSYIESHNDMLFYAHIVVYSTNDIAIDLANKLIDGIEDEDKTYGSALEFVDVSNYPISVSDNLIASPWINSDQLVYQARNQDFWSLPIAPKVFMRMKHLLTSKELRSIFKFPFDDGKLSGIESRRVSVIRERISQEVFSKDNFKVGILQNTMGSDKRDKSVAGIPLNDFTKHGLIVGMPGSGKTNFSLGLLLQFYNDFGIPFLAIEPTKSEYRSLIDGIPNLQVFTPGKSNISPYIINPFIPPKGVTVESYIPSLMTAFKAAFSMPSPLPDIFLAAINDCYNAYGWRLDSISDDIGLQKFGLYEFIKVFKRRIRNMDYKGDVKSNMESAGVVRLISLIEQNSNIYDTINTIPLEDLLSMPTVIELNAINNKEQKSLIMALLLIGICVYTKNNVAGDGKLKNVLLIDEAHVLLAASGNKGEDKADSQGSTIEALEDMIAEIRAYGTSIIIADQSPTKVGRNVVGNTNVKIVFKLVEKENKEAISTATNMTDAEVEQLGRLGVGEALLHYGRVYSPLLIKTFDVKEKAAIRQVISDSEIAQKTHYWDTHQCLLIPYNECSNNCECQTHCDFQVRSYADFFAASLIRDHFYNVADLEGFKKLLYQCEMLIDALVFEHDGIQKSLKLMNCTKIKFLRKAMLIKDFDISNLYYQSILKSKYYLKGEEFAKL